MVWQDDRTPSFDLTCYWLLASPVAAASSVIVSSTSLLLQQQLSYPQSARGHEPGPRLSLSPQSRMEAR
jgi:hypothetical protein